MDRKPGLVLARRLTRNLRVLADEVLAASRHVVLVGQPPVLRVGENVNLREFVAWKASRERGLPRLKQDDAAPRRIEILATMEALARRRSGVEVLRVDDAFRLPDGTVRYAEGRRFLYADDDHLSQAGAEVVQNRIAVAIATACGVASAPAHEADPHLAASKSTPKS